MNKFVIIDGHAIMHRAFHALPPLTDPKGQIVNAVYGFFSMFLKILEDVKPEYITVCFDRPKPTFRQSLYVGYQAHRPKMSEDLGPQIELIHEALRQMKIPIFEVDGYEADDLIGTLATQATEINTNTTNIKSQININEKQKEKNHLKFEIGNLKLEIIIVSGDRDMLQLVNSHVKVMAPITGITNMILFNAEKVEEKYGIKPVQIIDYKALRGDPSDGYPGVAGVGEKTAMQLLKEFETLENLYKNIDVLRQKNPNLALKLAEGAEAAGMAKKLATIVIDAPITLDIEKCNILHFDTKKAVKVFEEYGFKSLLKRLEQPEVSRVSKVPNVSKGEDYKESVKKDKNQQLGLI